MLGHRIDEGGRETWRYAGHSPEFMAASRAAIERMLRALAPSWLPAVSSECLAGNANPLFSRVADNDPEWSNPPENTGSR